MTAVCRIGSPLGTILAAGEQNALIGLWFEGQKYFAAGVSSTAQETDLPVFSQLREWLSVYFEGKQPSFTPPLTPKGSPFRQAVWKLLLSIPRGQVSTYGALAKQLAQDTGKAVSAQAVGGAVGHNPISILIPCHRVVGSTGSLTGYAGGIEKKIALLQLEGVEVDKLWIPQKGSAL